MFSRLRRVLAPLAIAPALALTAPAPAAHAARPDIVIPHGQTTVFSVPEGVERVVVGDQAVADVIVLPGQNRDVLINAKSPGFTNFLVWPSRGPVRNYKLEVLSSRRDESIAVRIRVLEATERKTGQVGVRWSESVGITEAAPDMPFRFGLPVRNELLSASLKLLAQEREIKVLAEPTLVIQSGKKAQFLAGGELPIPMVVNTGGAVNYTVDWKPFGIKLDVAPRLEGSNTITMDLRPEVSSIDPENAVNVQNLSVPGIATRFAQTTVALQSGESVVIAGLLRTEKNRLASKLPWLGDLPWVGYLFGSAQYDERVSELVFVVSPTVVQNNVVSPESGYGQGRPGTSRSPLR